MFVDTGTSVKNVFFYNLMQVPYIHERKTSKNSGFYLLR